MTKEKIWSIITILVWIVLIAYAFSCIGCQTIPKVSDLEKHEKVMIQNCCQE